MSVFINEQLIKELKKSNKGLLSVNGSQGDQYSPSEVDLILEEFRARSSTLFGSQLNKNETVVWVSVALQKKGNYSPNKKYELDYLKNKSSDLFSTLKLLRRVIEDLALPSTSAIRKLQISMCGEIFIVCNLLGIEGNLSRYITDPKLTNSERILLANFQYYNPECPHHIKSIIYSEIMRQKNKRRESNTFKAVF